MTTRSRFPAIAAIALTLVAAAAAAVTLQEVSQQAAALDAAARDHLEAVESAQPSEQAALVQEHSSLRTSQSSLLQDRATLGACQCASLDATLQSIDDVLDEASVIIDGWGQ